MSADDVGVQIYFVTAKMTFKLEVTLPSICNQQVFKNESDMKNDFDAH